MLTRDIADFAKRTHNRKAVLCLDATFSPPPLSKPFDFGVDFIVHSGTKFLGGHSDLLAGIIVCKKKSQWFELFEDRLLLGTILGSLESFLLLRSLRTLHLRVPVQSQSATKIVAWLENVRINGSSKLAKGTIKEIWHESLQKEEFVKKQAVGGFCPVFSFSVSDEEKAKDLVQKVKLFTHATSLGGYVLSLLFFHLM